MIDKLNFRLPQPLAGTDFLQWLRSNRIPVRETRLRDRKYYLCLGFPKDGIFIKGHSGSVWFDRIVSRPSAFNSFEDYYHQLRQLFGGSALLGATILRIDFAVDYPIELDRFLMSLDVRYKRSRAEFIEEGGARTGLNVGRGPERLVVYDRAKRTRTTTGPLTRLEIQLSGGKLPRKTFGELIALSQDPGFAPFASVNLWDVVLPEFGSVPTENLRCRLREFEVLFRNEGFLAARMKLGGHRNFARDYGRFLRLRPWSETPDEAVRRHLRTFLGGLRLQGEVS